MTRFKIETDEGTVILDPSKARRVWKGEADWDGRNSIYRSTGSQWVEQRLYLSKKGRYYIVEYSAWQGVLPKAWLVTPREAAAWLQQNGYELPDDLKDFDVIE